MLWDDMTLEEIAQKLADLNIETGTKKPNPDLAMELADRLTVEQGQALYHFAVLVTKLQR